MIYGVVTIRRPLGKNNGCTPLDGRAVLAALFPNIRRDETHMRQTANRRHRRAKFWAVSVLLGFILGCSAQAPYMRRWQPVEGVQRRWSGGTFKEAKLSDDEAAVYAEMGTPDVVRFFRAIDTRQKVYEWIYLEQEEVVWFVGRKRMEYVAVDTSDSPFTKETRETLQDKAVKGGVLGTLVGGVAAGVLLFGDSLGLKN